MRFAFNRLAARAAVLLAVATGGIAVAGGPAQAYDCTSPTSMEVIGNGAYVSAVASCSTSAGLGVSGWLQDSACDSKSAKVRVRTYYIAISGGKYLQWESTTTHSGGCNTGRSYSARGIEPARGVVEVCVWAEATFSSTSKVCKDMII
jgi:hypothetical protein